MKNKLVRCCFSDCSVQQKNGQILTWLAVKSAW